MNGMFVRLDRSASAPSSGRASSVLPLRAALLAAALVVSLGCGPSPEITCIERAIDRSETADLTAAERARVVDEMVRASERFGVDLLLLAAVIDEESGFRPTAKSRRHAVGLMQVLPATARAVADRHAIAIDGRRGLYAIDTNLAIGAAYMAELLEAFEVDHLALTAYHAGPTRARRARARDRDPSSRYASRVLERHAALRACVDRPETE